jgi:hypothetical protein
MIASRPLFTIRMRLHPLHDLGATPHGRRRIVPVAGGEFAGDRLRGTVLAHAGSDWLLERSDGAFQQDARVTLETDDHALIAMSYRGVRHASADVAARLARGEQVDPSDTTCARRRSSRPPRIATAGSTGSSRSASGNAFPTGSVTMSSRFSRSRRTALTRRTESCAARSSTQLPHR